MTSKLFICQVGSWKPNTWFLFQIILKKESNCLFNILIVIFFSVFVLRTIFLWMLYFLVQAFELTIVFTEGIYLDTYQFSL